MSMKSRLEYPIKFTPILKKKIWGGNALVGKFNKKSTKKNIGESWEISGVDEDVSVVSNGELRGVNLNELIREFKGDLVGEKVFDNFGDKFPLLFKFIDAKENLSIQLHPNDELAAKRHNSFGKTEMWYVMHSEENSELYAGLTKKLSKEEYLDYFHKGELLDIIHIDEVSRGDSYFIEVGTIHAIGAGIVLAEIQQTSDVTYRIYDWDRVDSNGNSRELHTDLAIDAIDLSKIGSCKLHYCNKINEVNNVLDCKYFTTNKLFVSDSIYRDYKELDSFIVYMCVSGRGQIVVGDKIEYLEQGNTVLIPAFVKSASICNLFNFELLEVYIK